MDEMTAAIARMEEQIRGLESRMSNLEKLTESVHNLSISLERMTAKQEAMETQLTGVAGDVDELKEKPAKYWGTVITGIISAAVGAIVAIILKK